LEISSIGVDHLSIPVPSDDEDEEINAISKETQKQVNAFAMLHGLDHQAKARMENSSDEAVWRTMSVMPSARVRNPSAYYTRVLRGVEKEVEEGEQSFEGGGHDGCTDEMWQEGHEGYAVDAGGHSLREGYAVVEGGGHEGYAVDAGGHSLREGYAGDAGGHSLREGYAVNEGVEQYAAGDDQYETAEGVEQYAAGEGQYESTAYAENDEAWHEDGQNAGVETQGREDDDDRGEHYYVGSEGCDEYYEEEEDWQEDDSWW